MIVQNVINNEVGLSPFIAKQKNIAPAVGAALVGAASSLVGGAVSSSGSWVKQQQQKTKQIP